jgi:small subunit ribosomal protein S14
LAATRSGELVARHAPSARRSGHHQQSKSTQEEKLTAVNAHAMPRDSSATQVRNRCNMSGRRAVLRHFGLSRIALGDMALNGLIPGVRKATGNP